MHSNSTAIAAGSVATRASTTDPVGIAGLILGIIALLQSSLFTTTAVMGMEKTPGYTPPPTEWGEPWEFSISTAMNGANINGSKKLKGAGGPFPNVYLFNDDGDYLGTSKDDNAYAKQNSRVSLNVYPNNVHKHEGQFATFFILAGKGDGRDPLCIVDMGLGKPNALDQENSIAFGAMTAASCGAAWYYSGVHRQNIKGYAPCFWVGGYGTQAIQVHLPSHTLGKTGIPLEALNDTIEVSHDYFCNRPAALRLWETIPEQHKVPKLLIADLDKRAGKTVNDTLALHQKKDLIQPGTRRLTSRGIPDPHEDTITIAHEFEGLSAIGLCENALSMGPDYVNIPEGKFCRMSDKTLWPTCDHQTKMGPKNDCFNVQSRQLIVGGKVTRGKPYNKEINFPLED